MNLETYIDIQQLLSKDVATHEQNRALGLSNEKISDIQKLELYRDEHLSKLPRPRLSEELNKYLYGVTLLLGVLSFVIGLLSGIGLLSYSGVEPVNVVYFIAMVVLVPLVTMGISIYSMVRAGRQSSVLVHLSASYWLEKIMRHMSGSIKDKVSHIQTNPSLTNFIVIQRAQLLALLFSVGLFVALMWKVSTQDLAFAWSTTLQISAQEFYDFLSQVSYVWCDILPEAVPSLELIEHSHYVRLGGKIGPTMMENASQLGEWWKFLAMSTLVYAILLRLFVWGLVSYLLGRTLKKSTLDLEGARRVLHEMSTPLVSTKSRQREKSFHHTDVSYAQITDCHKSSYDTILGWSMSEVNIANLQDVLGISSQNVDAVGGSNKISQDKQIISTVGADLLLFVKSWEPPTMDIIDFLDELSSKVEKITVLPISTIEHQYISKPREFDVWARKMQELENKKVWLCRRD